MKRLLPLLCISMILYWSCEEEVEEVDTTPPTVTITSHQSGESVSEMITITATSEDDKGVSKVEFYLNTALVETDTIVPYEYTLNTTDYDNEQSLTIKVISYDNSDNMAEVQIDLNVDNTTAVPQGGNITSVTYDLDSMTVAWEESPDGDFRDYKLLYSTTEDGDKDTVATYAEISITTHSLTEFDPLVENWFWVQVTDTLGLTIIGEGMSNSLESDPVPVNVTSVIFDSNVMTITWEEYNSDGILPDKFVSYELLQSNSKDGIYDSIIIITEKSNNSHSITGLNPTIQNWFKVKVADYWGLTSTGDEMMNDIFVLPSAELSISFLENDSLFINWIINDMGVSFYRLFEYQINWDADGNEIQNMTNQWMLENTDTSITILKPTTDGAWHYMVLVEFVWGSMTSESNVQAVYVSNCTEGEIGLWGECYSIENTTSLVLENSGLIGEIPESIGNLINLNELKLQDNQLSGSIPPEIGNLYLSNLDLSGNQLTGEIPPEIGDIVYLGKLDLNGNQLTGEIPPEIGDIFNLSQLNLSGNQLTGSIPPEIANISCVDVLNLGNNQLTGPIPIEIWNINCARFFYLNNNEFTGSIPENVEINSKVNFQIGGNQLTGDIPEIICPM